MIQRSALVLLGIVAITGCKKPAPTAGPDPNGKGPAGLSTSPTAGNAKVGDVMGGSFEGDIGFHIDPKKEKQKPMDVMLHIKKDKVRIDLPDEVTKEAAKMVGPGNVYALLHTGDKKAYAVMEGSKQAIMIDLDKSADQLKGMAGQREGAPPPGAKPDLSKLPKVTRTGKKSKVAGLDCEDWEFKNQDKNNKAIVCIAEGETSWLKLPTKLLPDQLGFAAELMDGKHMPLRLIALEGETEVARVEATKIEKKPITDAQVNVPEGYKVTDMMEYITSMRAGGMRPPTTGAGKPPVNLMANPNKPPPKPPH